MSRAAIEKVLAKHAEAERKQGRIPKVEELRRRIVKVARESDNRHQKGKAGHER